MSDAPSILSLRLTRAYGSPSETRRTPMAAPAGVVSVRRQDTFPAPTQRLVAATVPGGIAFDTETGVPSPTRDAIPMYRHPADRNAAAVAIELGRAVDVRG